MKKIIIIAAYLCLYANTYGQKVYKGVQVITYVNNETSDSVHQDGTIYYTSAGKLKMISFPKEKVSVVSEMKMAGYYKEAPVYWFHARNQKNEPIRGTMLKLDDGCFFVFDVSESDKFSAYFLGMENY